LPRLRQRCEQGALLRIEHAGFLELAIALERLDGGRGLVVSLAVDQAVVVAGPGEVELNGKAVGLRERGIAAGRRGRRGRAFAGGGRGHAQRAFTHRRRSVRRSNPADGGAGMADRGPDRGLAKFSGLCGGLRGRAARQHGITLGGGGRRDEQRNDEGTQDPHGNSARLERDDFCLNRHPALAFWWSMIFFRKPPPPPQTGPGPPFCRITPPPPPRRSPYPTAAPPPLRWPLGGGGQFLRSRISPPGRTSSCPAQKSSTAMPATSSCTRSA